MISEFFTDEGGAVLNGPDGTVLRLPTKGLVYHRCVWWLLRDVMLGVVVVDRVSGVIQC